MGVHDIELPWIFYGTAWKEERTAGLTSMALEAGFRAIDTANQRKHYHEAAVGEGIAASGLDRDELFLQTKFTHRRGQDDRLPYDPDAGLATQVRQSFASSLEHLRTDHLDSYVLHGPWAGSGWHPEDRETWAAMEAIHASGQARLLSISNISAEQLDAMCDAVRVRPAFVQNRCYASEGWDRAVREVCRRRGLRYQGFSLLTANRSELRAREVRALAKRLGATVPQLVFRFAAVQGMLPLTGTSDRDHMRADLESPSLVLDPEAIATIDGIGMDGRCMRK